MKEIKEVIYKDKILKLNPPVEINSKLIDGYYVANINNYPYDFCIYADKEEKLEEAFIDEIIFLYEEYVCCDESEMSDSCIKFKKDLMEKITIK